MDIAVLVNLRARRGSANVARACRTSLPDARILASSSLDEAQGFARELSDRMPSLLVSAGGDGTAVALLNALRLSRAMQPGGGDDVMPATVGLLPLGTGNGWANAMGAPRWRRGVERLGRLAARGGPVPVLRYDLVEVEGVVAPFAGTGWDAELIDDFHAQKEALSPIPEKHRKGLAGYLNGLFTRTIPRNVAQREMVEVELVNSGEDAFTVNEEGHPIPLRGGEHGAVLYRGPVSVCAAGTTSEWGFGFRAFPFARTLSRRFCMRAYAAGAVEATLNMGRLWEGRHPLDKMYTWLLTECTACFSRPVPFQIGGDRLGQRTDVVYRLAREQVDLLDWRTVGSA